MLIEFNQVKGNFTNAREGERAHARTHVENVIVCALNCTRKTKCELWNFIMLILCFFSLLLKFSLFYLKVVKKKYEMFTRFKYVFPMYRISE